MKQFLYLDTDIVASIIAQSEKGLITQMMREQGGEEEKEQGKSVSGNAKASGGGAFWRFLQAEAELGVDGQISTSKIVHSSSKEIVEKTLHDASFDIACTYIQPKESIAGEAAKDNAGEYIKIKRAFTFVDFAYLEGLFAKNGAIDIYNKIEARKIEDPLDTKLGRDQRRQSGSAVKKQINLHVKQNSKQLEDAATVIRLIKGLVPYSRMLFSFDGYLIPLDEKYFRIDPSNLGFKYGGEIACVGLITNIIGESSDPDYSKDVFAEIQFLVNGVLRSILPTNGKDLCVVHPIALYYGE